MFKKLIGFFFLLQVLSGCSHYKYWDISKFNIDVTALKDQDSVILLYTCHGPDYNQDMDYFTHLIAVSQTTGDTVNILTTVYSPVLTAEDKDKIFIFYSQDNWAGRLIQMDPDKLCTIKTIEDIPEVDVKKITKVARNPDYDDLADNHYPAVIGTVLEKIR